MTSLSSFVPAPRQSPENEPRRRRPRARLPLALAATDVVALSAAGLSLRDVPALFVGVTAVVLLLLGGGAGLYRSRLTPSVLDDLPQLTGRACIGGAVLAFVSLLQGERAGWAVLRFTAAVLLLVIVGRAVVFAGVRWARRSGRVRYSTLIVGCGEFAGQLAQVLIDHPEVGLRPVGFLDDSPLVPESRRPAPHLGPFGALVDVIRDRSVSHVVMAFGSAPESDLVKMIRSCDRLSCEIFFVPRLYEVHALSSGMEIVWGFPLVRMRRAAFRAASWRLKRLIDITASGLALLVLSPLMAVTALAVHAAIGSPVLFRQERVGLDGKPFQLLKYCTLRPVDATESGRQWTVAGDSRLHPVARFLRRTSLDELPQLWNILRGDMSLVGPRPERPFFVEAFRQQYPAYTARHRVPAGLTGAAQVAGLRGDTSIGDRARFDNAYIENWSVWLDIKIMMRTFGQIVFGKGG